VTCSRCEKVNTRPGASVIFKPKVSKKKRSLEEATGATPATNQEIALDNESIKRRKIKGAPSSDPQPNISSSCTGSTPSVSQSEVSIHEDSEVKVSTDSLKNQGELATNVPEFKSIFAPPPSPPRKLLDGPKKKKKKKTDSGTKSSLDSFLKSLRS
jgi:hypothetical protein